MIIFFFFGLCFLWGAKMVGKKKKTRWQGFLKILWSGQKIKFELLALSTDRTGPLSQSLDFFCYVEYVMYVCTWDWARSLDKVVDRVNGSENITNYIK